MDFKKLDAIIDTMQDDLIADLRKLISYNTVKAAPAEGAPFGQTTLDCLRAALAMGEREGFATQNFDGYCGHIVMGEGEKHMGILCHLDVVPAGEGWTKDPFGGEIADGKIYGRGVMDDKGAAIASLYAMKAVKQAGIPMAHAVRLILGCDEETGMTDMRHYAEVAPSLPDYGFSPDAEFPCINIEKGGLGALLSKDCGAEDGALLPVLRMTAGERCNVVPGKAYATLDYSHVGYDALRSQVEAVAERLGFELVLTRETDSTATLMAVGESAHASLPHLGKNAAGMLLIALKELRAGGGCASAIACLADKLGLEGDGRSLGIAVADEESGALTCNLGILRFDGRVLTAQLDIRYPLCASEEKMMGQMAMTVGPCGIGATWLNGHAPHYVPADSPIVQGLLRAYGDVTGKEAYAFAIGGGTYSRCMPNTVAFGLTFPGDDDVAHMPDEYFELDKLMLSVKILAHAIAELGAAKE